MSHKNLSKCAVLKGKEMYNLLEESEAFHTCWGVLGFISRGLRSGDVEVKI